VRVRRHRHGGAHCAVDHNTFGFFTTHGVKFEMPAADTSAYTFV